MPGYTFPKVSIHVTRPDIRFGEKVDLGLIILCQEEEEAQQAMLAG